MELFVAYLERKIESSHGQRSNYPLPTFISCVLDSISERYL
jgi:hypothetical protein